MASSAQTQDIGVFQVDGWTFLTVPWNRARVCQRYLHSHSIGSTLVLDPLTGEASLDLRTNVSPERVGDLLRDWGG